VKKATSLNSIKPGSFLIAPCNDLFAKNGLDRRVWADEKTRKNVVAAKALRVRGDKARSIADNEKQAGEASDREYSRMVCLENEDELPQLLGEYVPAKRLVLGDEIRWQEAAQGLFNRLPHAPPVAVRSVKADILGVDYHKHSQRNRITPILVLRVTECSGDYHMKPGTIMTLDCNSIYARGLKRAKWEDEQKRDQAVDAQTIQNPPDCSSGSQTRMTGAICPQRPTSTASVNFLSPAMSSRGRRRSMPSPRCSSANARPWSWEPPAARSRAKAAICVVFNQAAAVLVLSRAKSN